MKERSMERILIAQARDNYWKRYREREKEEGEESFENEWRKVAELSAALGDTEEEVKEMTSKDVQGVKELSDQGEGVGNQGDV